jgi:hypothetical protein
VTRTHALALAAALSIPAGVVAAAALPAGAARALRSRRSFTVHEDLGSFESEHESFRIEARDWKTVRYEVVEGDRDTRVTIRRPDDTTFTLREGRALVDTRPPIGRYDVVLSNLGFGSEDVTLRVTLRR